MNKAIVFFSCMIMTSCEEKQSESDERSKDLSYSEWHEDYMNSRQNDSTEDVCNEYYQDCIDAGYPPESCAIRLEACSGMEDRENREERENQREGSEERNDECASQAERAYEECISNGGSAADCRQTYADTYDDCMNQ